MTPENVTGERPIAGGGPMRLPVIRELDGIRAIAVFIVFLAHAGMGRMIPGGLGVTIFFFLSGYLITSLMRAEASTTGRIDYPAFYARRTLRIFPPLYITLAFSALIVVLLDRGTVLDPWAVVSQIVFFSNYAKVLGAGNGLPGPPLWSLAVEEHFYLIFPWLFGAFLMRMSGRRASLTCLVACALPLAFRLFNGIVLHNVEINYFLTHTRIDSILFGCALALWQNPVLDGPTAWRPGWLALGLAGVAVLGAAVARNPFFGDTFRYTMQGLGLLVIFSWVLHGHPISRAVLNWLPVQLVGRYSYSIYLVHTLLLSTLAHLMGFRGLVVALAAAVAAMIYGALMFYLVDRPLARIRHKLHREPAPAPDEAISGAVSAELAPKHGAA